MTEQEKLEFEKLKNRVASLEGTLLAILRHEAKAARSSTRRLKNMLDRDERQLLLFDGLADDLQAGMTGVRVTV